MKKALVFALFGLGSLFWVGLVSGLQVFESWDSLTVDSLESILRFRGR